MLTGPEHFGRFYWCIKTSMSKSDEIYIHADDARIMPDGTLSLVKIRDGQPPSINVAIAPGSWSAVYQASAKDGSPVAVEFWEGQVTRKSA